MIKGKSGTGKTTLLNQLGLVAPLACDYLMAVSYTHLSTTLVTLAIFLELSVTVYVRA